MRVTPFAFWQKSLSLFSAIVFVLALSCAAQSQTSQNDTIVDRDAEIRELRATVKELQQRVARLESEHGGQSAEVTHPDETSATVPQQSLVATNTSTTAPTASASLTPEDR